jgi:hypothetical protein
MTARLMMVPIAAAVLAAACAAPSPPDRITAAGILHDVEVLSADSMEGRAPGTAGEARAIAYIRERFRQVGLEPVGEDYLLPVELLGMTRNEAALRVANADAPPRWVPGHEFETAWRALYGH